MMPIFDGHNDTLRKLYLEGSYGINSFFEKRDKKELDITLPRAEKAGLKGGIFSINVPDPEGKDPMEGIELTGKGYVTPLPNPIDHNYAKDFTEKILNFSTLLEETKEKVKIVRNFKELRDNCENGLFSIVLHFEGGEAIDKDLENLKYFYNKGLRVLAPVWSRKNKFGTGVPFSFGVSSDIGPGLTKKGKELITECEKMGITVDLSHMNEKSFWDTIENAKKPLVATHSNVYSLSKSTRNLTDEQINAIGNCHGVVGVNFSAGFIRSDGLPNRDTPIEVLIKHIDYIVNLIGIDGVAIGSDYDGAMIINDLKNVEHLPRLLQALKSRYSKSEIAKICYRNWFRILKSTWET